MEATALARTSNENLGKWGESQFEGLCAAQGLVANKAGVDTMGWDYFVQRPPQRKRGVFLDHRPLGLGCHVQVKTVWASDSPRAFLSLAAAERLAKHEGPAFILLIVAEADADERPVLGELWLIHLEGPPMRRVLLRLRQAEVGLKPKPLTQQTISFAAAEGERLAPGGADLAVRLDAHCGEDAEAYAAKKRKARKALGYEKGVTRITATFTAESEAQLVDMLLGLEPAAISNVEVFDLRFGLEAPIPQPAVSNWSFETQPARTCTIRVSGPQLGAPAVFSGDVILPPLQTLPREHWKVRFRTDLFNLTWDGRGNVAFTADHPFRREPQPLSRWRRDLRFAELMAGESVTFEVEAEGMPLVRLPAIPAAQGDLDKASELREAVQYLTELFDLAGADNPSVDLDDVWLQRRRIDLARTVLLAPDGDAWEPFRTAGPSAENTTAMIGWVGEPLPMLYIDRLTFGCFALAIAGVFTTRAKREGDCLLWRIERVTPRAARVIPTTDEAIRNFAAAEQSASGARGRIVSEGAEPARLPDTPPAGGPLPALAGPSSKT